ncbi:hypothetical protein ZWY2020_029254 [Hordeum vulgare]|nr:hypothetical protein ZWY2020_029254 [Hordeum vulgare]
MASSDSAGRDLPAARAAAVVNDLIEVREGAMRLKGMLQEQSSGFAELMDGILNKLSSALSALDTGCTAGASASGRPMGLERSSGKRVTDTLVDGHIWRKYGQKEIQNSTHPRSYYRCTHKSDQGCNAKRQVQICETHPIKYAVTYYGEHTCKAPSNTPMIIVPASGDRADNLVSFAPTLPQLLPATTQLSSSWCTSVDDVFSSSSDPFVQADELAVIVGSAGKTSSTVGSVPDYSGSGIGDMARGGTGSFASSPSSLGFVVGSLGSIVDDDFFQFDP